MRKRKQLQEWLSAAKLAKIDPASRDRLARDLAPISRAYLRRLLLESGLPLDPLVEGVRQTSLDEAERTLVALAGLYPQYPRETRKLVIEAKDHARLARHDELVEWMIVWVNDPALFPAWVRLRRQAIESRWTERE